jgi:hypothetical protein
MGLGFKSAIGNPEPFGPVDLRRLSPAAPP